jgi:hypothetical protein
MKNGVMENENVAERAVALAREYLDVMRRTERTPDAVRPVCLRGCEEI